jgi:hypothetical protein
MSYSSLIKNSKEKVYNHAIASKIRNLMDELRLEADDISERRWIWELLQNAKDVKQQLHDLDIAISLTIENEESGTLEFKHTGQTFSVDNITFLIEQISTKDRKKDLEAKPITTGKFGTGFLTTHLLSEIVEVTGVLKEPELPFTNFTLTLDRSGRELEDIIKSVDNSLEQLNKFSEESPLIDYNPDAFNTFFRYKLDDHGVKVAKKGLEDLFAAIPYTMVFAQEIHTVEVPLGVGVTFSLLSDLTEEIGKIRIYTVCKESLLESENILIATASTEKVTIAIEIERQEHQVKLKALQAKLPKLHCDFPLIGTETFHFPVVIQSSYFNPNDPRNGIFLQDNSDSKILENKDLLQEAVDLYFDLLLHASNNKWSNIHLLANIKMPPIAKWLSESWYESKLLKPIRDKLLITPIVYDSDYELRAIKNDEGKANTWFPDASKKEIREMIYDLCFCWIPGQLPHKDLLEAWNLLTWKDCNLLNLHVISNSIQTRENVKTLAGLLSDDINVIDWLNQYYLLLNKESIFIKEIIADKYRVIPDQHGNFKKRGSLFLDDQVHDSIKDILGDLGVDIRSELRHNSIITQNTFEKDPENEIRYAPKKKKYFYQTINQLLKDNDSESATKAICQLSCLIPRNLNQDKNRNFIRSLCVLFYPNYTGDVIMVNDDDSEIWEVSDEIIILKVIREIGQCENIISFADRLSKPVKDAILWLDNFIDFMVSVDMEGYLNLSGHPILPNQHGIFHLKDDLFSDAGNIDDRLKDIVANLGHDFRDELIDKRLSVEFPGNRAIDATMVAERIKTLITPLFAELPRSKETKEIFRLIFLWFSSNKESASAIFGDLFINKHKLYDDEEIANSIEKAEQVTNLMDELNISSIDELRERLSPLNSSADPSQLLPITQDILISLGVSSFAELQEALKDKNLAELFSHTSIPSHEMFLFVQGLINRAKAAVLKHLSNHPDYDCTEAEEIAQSVIANVKKFGRPIHIVVRPSDNGEVILYYTSEKDTLEEESELWVEDGKSLPQQITLGRIVKVNQINKIRI